jgi:hypothetical protein
MQSLQNLTLSHNAYAFSDLIARLVITTLQIDAWNRGQIMMLDYGGKRDPVQHTFNGRRPPELGTPAVRNTDTCRKTMRGWLDERVKET